MDKLRGRVIVYSWTRSAIIAQREMKGKYYIQLNKEAVLANLDRNGLQAISTGVERKL